MSEEKIRVKFNIQYDRDFSRFKFEKFLTLQEYKNIFENVKLQVSREKKEKRTLKELYHEEKSCFDSIKFSLGWDEAGFYVSITIAHDSYYSTWQSDLIDYLTNNYN